MQHRNVSRWAICFLFAALAFPGRATADVIRVTGGALDMGNFSGTLDITGERGFALSSRVDAVSGLYWPWMQCNVPSCTPGTEVSLLARWAGSALGGSMSFEGRTFDDVGGAISRASASVEFMGSFIAPPMAPSAVVMTPFSFSGLFSVPDPMGPGSFLHSLVGAGTVTVQLVPNNTSLPGAPAWMVASALYEFSAADPVPEPATLLMVGAGIAAVARRVRCKREPI
jgi:hypothetical protein